MEMDERLHERKVLKIKIICSIVLCAVAFISFALWDVNVFLAYIGIFALIILAWMWIGMSSDNNKKKK